MEITPYNKSQRKGLFHSAFFTITWIISVDALDAAGIIF
jgi:hypothetical protein